MKLCLSLRPAQLALALMLAGAGAQAATPTIRVDHPWARGTVAGQPAGGAFLTLVNAGTSADRLVGASSPAADHVELHTMRLDGDVMKMREVDAIDLPAGQSVALEPGKLHLMLQGLKAPLKVGSRFPLSLKFEKGEPVTVDVEVESAMQMHHDMKP
jgi:periplasmic copper chaperone A